jgi:hypothetical protein
VSTALPPQAAGPSWDQLQRRALVAAGAGLLLFAAAGLLLLQGGWLDGPGQLFLSYLVGYNFWLGIALGCLVILMLQHLTGGAWGVAIRRVLESGTRTLALLAVLFIPVCLGLPYLYLWAQPDEVAHDPNLQHKSIFLNVPFFVIRAIVYFAIWLVVAFFLNRWSARQDEEVNPWLPRRFRLLSAPGLALYGLTITFASIDWVMSLEPHWYSTIYPVMFATGQVLTGLAFAIAVVIGLADRPPLAEVLTPRLLRDLGSLLLTFVMFWAYMSISQFLLIWVGNLPEEIPWYLRRTRGGWEWVALVVIVLHFALPFLLLLSRDIKENGRKLAAVAVGLLALRFLDVFWWIEPAVGHDRPAVFWLLDVGALLGVGGIWGWWFVGQLKSRPLLPVHEVSQEEAAHHE